MSRLTDEKEEQAIRILEAMSGVDEELLARSEQKMPVKQRAGIVNFWYRHGKAMAAALCLAVLGTAFWGISSLNQKSSNDASAAEPQGFAMSMESIVADTTQAEVAEACEEAATEMEWEPEYAAEEDTADWNGEIKAGNAVEAEKAQSESRNEMDELKQSYMMLGNPMKQLTEEEFAQAFGRIPTAPAGAEEICYFVLQGELTVGQQTYRLDNTTYCMRFAQTEEAQDISGMYYEWDTVHEDGDTYGVYCTMLTDRGQGVCLWQQNSMSCAVSMEENASEERLTEARRHFAAQLAE